MKYSPERLTNLLTTDREKLTRICAEVCYGWLIISKGRVGHGFEPIYIGEDVADSILVSQFQPLANTVSGRSQAFELAVKFDCFPHKTRNGLWRVLLGLSNDKCETPQDAIVVEAILTAQQENNDE